MLTHPTLDQLHQLGLLGMAKAFADVETSGEAAALAHPEWLACKFARNSGSDALLMASQISGADDACLQQVDFAPTIHLAFNELQLGDLPLGLTIRPG